MRTKVPELTQEREALIRNAAQRRFAAFGLRKSTMEEIAADLGMSKTALYYYFPTKEELFRRVVQHEQQTYLDSVEKSLATKASAADKLRIYAAQRLEFFRDLLNLSALNYSSWVEMKPLFNDLFQNFSAEEKRLITTILEDGKRCGEFNIVYLEKTAQMILHVLHGLRLRFLKKVELARTVESDYTELAEEAATFVELLLYGLVPRKQLEAV